MDLFEANEKLGKKLYITGKGRCNVTNACEPNEVLGNVVSNNKFLYSSLYSFTSYDTITFFENLGVPIKIERGNRAFPESDKSSDVISALKRYLDKSGVNVMLNTKVLDVQKINNLFIINTISGMYKDYDATIICTGGCTYSATGSTGDGLKLAEKFGHTITPIKAGLVPILIKDNFVKSLEGLSLKNVTLKAYVKNKPFKEFFGEMLFTSNGISGPIALSLSSYITKQEDVRLFLDFKPALSYEKLLARLNRDILQLKEKQVNTLMQGLLPKAFVNVFLKRLNIDCSRKNKTLLAREIEQIVSLLKCFELQYNGLDKLDFGIITSGGVSVKEIDPKTMQSKIISGLYFAGEVIDIDALTGGFNLQLAWSTAMTVANNIKSN